MLCNIKETIDRIYADLPKKALKSTDVIADITPGNRPMIAAIILSCIHSDRNIEYVEQSTERKLIEIEITPALIESQENRSS